MVGKISRATRREIIDAVGERYRSADRDDKRRLLDEFVSVTGYHRKHVVRLLNKAGSGAPARRSATPRPRTYNEAVTRALTTLWEASDRVCGKRLVALLPILIPALERHGRLDVDAGVRGKLLAASASTIDRLLRDVRSSAAGGRRRRRASPAVRRGVPVRTFADWEGAAVGFMEIDLVAHAGESMAGSFVHTLVLTDVFSGWTECVPLVVREATLVVEGIAAVRPLLPFALRGLDSDNGSEFINQQLVDYCTDNAVEFTRSRPYRKNDQAWVEQKNGAVVRKMVGYGRLEGLSAASSLARLYTASRMFVNFFQPSFKLAEKVRNGARVSKRYHPPATPCDRLLGSTAVPEEQKAKLRDVRDRLDPLLLLHAIRAEQESLAQIASGKPIERNGRQADLDSFLRSLSRAWAGGEVRATHRAAPPQPRHWRTRADPFDGVWPEVEGWLEAEPDRTAKELLARLVARQPTRFDERHLRTLQRRVKTWRAAAAMELLRLRSPTTVGPSPQDANGMRQAGNITP